MRLGKHSNLFVFCSMVLVAGTSTLLAQLSDVPVKAGLWETHVITKIGASDIDGGPDQSCFSAGTTLSDYLTATNKGAPGTKCSVTNKVVTAHGIAYDTACMGETMASKGHIDFRLQDAEHFSGTSHTTVTGSTRGKPVNMAIDKTFTAKFLKSDCGDVQPLVTPAAR